MKKIFSKLGFKMADEMEKSIQLKSISQNLVLIFSQLFLQQQMVDGADEKSESSFWKIVMIIVIAAAVIVASGSFIFLFTR